MDNNLIYSAVIVAFIGVLTFLARYFPFLLFSRGGKEPAKIITYLGDVLPPAVMMLLIVYSLKSVSLTQFPYGLAEGGVVLLVILLYKLTKNNLIAMVGGTICYMVLIQTVFS